jgi:hypothetical protein
LEWKLVKNEENWKKEIDYYYEIMDIIEKRSIIPEKHEEHHMLTMILIGQFWRLI